VAINGYSLKLVTIAACCNGVCGLQHSGLGRPVGFGGRALGGPHLMGAPFYGYDPVGNYAIHILVNNRTVTLAGVVDNEGDKTLAGLKARGVANVNQVNNELEVAAKP
jgi:hypothetical protein